MRQKFADDLVTPSLNDRSRRHRSQDQSRYKGQNLTLTDTTTTRLICAAVLRPQRTKAVDAALVFAKMLVPEPMRPGWSGALRMVYSRSPHQRLPSLDARLGHAAARPVIVPEAIVTDCRRTPWSGSDKIFVGGDR
jgi:hypothetical protein